MKRFVLLLALTGCPMPEPRPLPYTPQADGGFFNPDAEPIERGPEQVACARMCNNMQNLGCPLGEPTPVRHEPCDSWCTRTQLKHEIDVHPDCISKVTSCAHVKDCDK